MATGFAFMGVREMAGLFARKEASPIEVLDDVIGRLSTLEPKLNMFACLDLEGARKLAQASEQRMMRGERIGILDGIPTSIKDLIAMQGLPLRSGSKASADTPAALDAPVTERLRNAGAVLLGKSTTSEFGCKAVGDSPLTGITRNPWNLDMTPGGSSCGAAAAVASGLLPYTIGTDGGGSLRIPGALCGLVGFKAQFARIPIFPVSATPTLAHVGPLTRTCEDAAAVLSVICGYDRRDPFTVAGPVPDFAPGQPAGRPLRIAWSPTLGYARADAEVLSLCEKAAKSFEALGHHVDVVDHVMDDPGDIWTAEFYAGVGTRLRATVETAPELIDPAVLEVLKEAISQDMRSYYDRVFARYAFREKMREFFEDYDLLLSPTLPTAAFPVGLNTPPGYEDRSIVSWVYYTYPFNLTGQPAASIPAGLTSDGLPVGLQIVAGAHDDALLFEAASAYEPTSEFTAQAQWPTIV
ncbi:aspartyl-tRNA(Asn)/glutamyl-tRNA(Gln) amidotransferase subunit A [Filomicrobium insigne]|uniref:Aspartyl-tRNA(Asn)/glutamyl-tRNA(Gln) amidotransferase subunit A n=1 Tax=Filomicrobium insigne TaxID=418854 RepID=A0A1H0H7Q7_9HYPH|nr:amidase family protein [Filomicrobium insigne]SDO15178.1 aspartyl-tRNA(Asn)/glutamyl-tRNA(Gln) amidotransferase subunit A [Filomicrobium insigne]